MAAVNGKVPVSDVLVTQELSAFPLRGHTERISGRYCGWESQGRQRRTLHSHSQSKILAGENEQFPGLSSGWVCCWRFMV